MKFTQIILMLFVICDLYCYIAGGIRVINGIKKDDINVTDNGIRIILAGFIATLITALWLILLCFV